MADLTPEQKDYKAFTVAKHWIYNRISARHSYADSERYSRLWEELKDRKGLEDACVLLKMILKEVGEYNAKIKSKITLLNSMRYKEDWKTSKVFGGENLPLKEINKLIDQYPTTDEYEIYRGLMGQTIREKSVV